ncbi:MAG: hypothetical protein WCR20_01320 [Verrucomicrobiota bacterium]
MNEDSFQLKPACTVKFNQEEQAYATEQINEMHPEYDQFTTFKTVFNDLLYRATAKTKQSNQARPEDTETIQLLNNEIGRLKMLIDLTQKDNEELKEAAMLLKSQAESAEADLIDLQRIGMKLEDNQTIVTFNPLVAVLLDKEVQASTERTRKTFSREDILKNLFWDTLRRRNSYPLYLLYSDAEIAAIAKTIKPEAAQ